MPSLTGFQYDANAKMPGFDPLPEGKYVMAIVASEQKPTADGLNEYLKLTLQVLEGEHQGRKLWQNLNLWHSSAQVVQYAKAEMSLICRATGKFGAQSSEELHDVPLLVEVKVKKGSNGEPQNAIKNYLPIGAASQSQPSAPAAGGAAQPPWMKGRP